jgi:predicted hydrocarbon binding protein
VPLLEPSGLYYPNRFARLFLLAMEDVMGRQGLHTILSIAGLETYAEDPPPDNMARQFDFTYMAAFSLALENMYGARGGRGIALRIGRAMFSNGMKDFGALAGMASPAFQMLPLEKRLDIGINALASVFSRFSDQDSQILEVEDAYHFVVDISPIAWGRTAERPVCHALTGIIQESMRWSSKNYEFHVQEIECRAAGNDTCVFKVNKKPMGGATLG